MAEIDFAAEASAGMMMYGLPTSPTDSQDHIRIHWKGSSHNYDTVVVVGDRFGSIVEDSLASDAELIGDIRLHFGNPQQHRREHIAVGELSISNSLSTLFVRMSKTTFEQASFEFLGELCPPTTKRIVYVQTKSFNSSFLNKRAPAGILRVSTGSKDELIESFNKYQALPQGYFLHSMAAATLNSAQVQQIPAAVLLYDVEKEDLLSTATSIYDISKLISAGVGLTISPSLDSDVYKHWRKRVTVDGTAHLYL